MLESKLNQIPSISLLSRVGATAAYLGATAAYLGAAVAYLAHSEIKLNSDQFEFNLPI